MTTGEIPRPPSTARPDTLRPWLGNVLIGAAGIVVATAVALDQSFYLALAIGGLMFIVIVMRRPQAGLLVWMFTFPLLDPYVRLDLPAGIPDVTLNRVVTTLVVVTLMLEVMLRRRRLLPIGSVERCMLVLCAMMGFDIYMRSASVGQDALLLFDEFLTPFLLFAVFKNLIGAGADVRKVLLVLALSSLYLAPHGAYQFITKSELPFWIGPPETVHSLIEEQGRARGPFTDSVSYGALGNVVFLSTLFAFGWSATRRTWLGLLLLPAASTVFLCLTRSVWLGLLIALLVAAYAERRLRKPVATLLICGMLAGATAFFWPQDSTDVVAERATDYETIYIRLSLYKAALTMAAQQPLIGYGRHATDLFQRDRAEYVSAIGAIDAEYGTLAGPPHNAFLSILLMYGVFGVMAYIALFALLVRAFVALRRVRSGAPLPPRAYAALMLALSVVYLSVAMFTDVMAFNFFSNLYFLLAGGADGLRRRAIVGGHALGTRSAISPRAV